MSWVGGLAPWQLGCCAGHWSLVAGLIHGVISGLIHPFGRCVGWLLCWLVAGLVGHCVGWLLGWLVAGLVAALPSHPVHVICLTTQLPSGQSILSCAHSIDKHLSVLLEMIIYVFFFTFEK